jgi:hypothetical protein
MTVRIWEFSANKIDLLYLSCGANNIKAVNGW